MFSSSIGISTVETLRALWLGVVSVVPKIIVAILVFIIGWLIALLIQRAIVHFIRAIKLDTLLSHTGLDEVVRKAGYKLDSGLFIGAIFKWFVIILFLKMSLGIVELTQIDVFLDSVIHYLPSVVVAVIALFAGSIIADAMAKFVTGSAKAAEVGEHHFIGEMTRWVIWIFVILLVLSELNIGKTLVDTLTIGIVSMLALAGGLAFGLGGKDLAGKILNKISKPKK